MNAMNRDGLLNISLLEGQARALLIESTELTERARQVHGLSRIATAALGRTLTATAMMASMLKGKGESLSVTIKGGGPIGSIVTVGHPDGSVKGYCDNPGVDLPRTGKKLPVGAAVGTVTVPALPKLPKAATLFDALVQAWLLPFHQVVEVAFHVPDPSTGCGPETPPVSHQA